MCATAKFIGGIALGMSALILSASLGAQTPLPPPPPAAALPGGPQPALPGAPPVAAVSTPPPAAVTTPLVVSPAEDGIALKAQKLSAIEADLALAMGSLKLATTEAANRDVQTKMTGVKSGTNTIPELVAISGTSRHLQAEFLAGSAVVRVVAGDWITQDWRVVSLSPNGVSLARKGGREKHEIVFGNRPTSSQEMAADMARVSASLPQDNTAPVAFSTQMPVPARR